MGATEINLAFGTSQPLSIAECIIGLFRRVQAKAIEGTRLLKLPLLKQNLTLGSRSVLKLISDDSDCLAQGRGTLAVVTKPFSDTLSGFYDLVRILT